MTTPWDSAEPQSSVEDAQASDHASVPTPREVAAAHGAPPAEPGTGPPRGSSSGHVPAAEPDDGDDLADRVVATVLAVPGVVRLHAGAFGEVATYLPGRAVTGVRLRPDETEVHLVASTERPIPSVAREVHEAVRTLVHGPVHVYVEDVASPPSSPPAP